MLSWIGLFSVLLPSEPVSAHLAFGLPKTPLLNGQMMQQNGIAVFAAASEQESSVVEGPIEVEDLAR